MMKQQDLPMDRIGTEPVQKPGSSKQDYGTPRAFVDACEARFGRFVCDLAATAENAKAPEWYDEIVDSLAASSAWSTDYPDGNLWLNPPFGNLARWAAKCAREAVLRRGLIIMLTPASIGTDWFAQHVHDRAMVLGIAPRLAFEGCTDAYPKDLMISVFGMGLRGFDVWRWKAAA